MKKLLISLVLILSLSTNAYSQALMSFGQVVNSFISNAGGAGTNGTAFALPTNPASVLSWTTSYASAPTSVTITLQGSLDNSAWYTLDTSTNTAGELRTVQTSARFVRAVITAKSGGGDTTVSMQTRAYPTSNASLFSGGTVTGVTNFLAAVTFDVATKFADGTVALPSVTFTNDLDTGRYRIGANNVGEAVNGALVFDWNATRLLSVVTVRAPSLGLPNTGAAATSGRVTLVAGTATVSTTAASVTANIFLQRMTTGGTPGFATQITRNPGNSFTITADNVLDTSVYMWWIVEVY